jgi:hypothetical protein
MRECRSMPPNRSQRAGWSPREQVKPRRASSASPGRGLSPFQPRDSSRVGRADSPGIRRITYPRPRRPTCRRARPLTPPPQFGGGVASRREERAKGLAGERAPRVADAARPSPRTLGDALPQDANARTGRGPPTARNLSAPGPKANRRDPGDRGGSSISESSYFRTLALSHFRPWCARRAGGCCAKGPPAAWWASCAATCSR